MTFSWGVVHTVTPLTVKLDGSSNALPVIQSLVDPSSLVVGDMVRVELAQGGRVVVYGLPGGDSRVGVNEGDISALDGRVGVNEGDIADLARGQDGIPFAMAAGDASAGGSSVTVTFPSGRFTVGPIVTAQIPTGSSDYPGTNAISATSFDIRNASGSSSRTIQWMAVQMTSGSASG